MTNENKTCTCGSQACQVRIARNLIPFCLKKDINEDYKKAACSVCRHADFFKDDAFHNDIVSGYCDSCSAEVVFLKIGHIGDGVCSLCGNINLVQLEDDGRRLCRGCLETEYSDTMSAEDICKDARSFWNGRFYEE